MEYIENYVKQMRENCVKNTNGNIICSPELWEEIAELLYEAGCRKQKWISVKEHMPEATRRPLKILDQDIGSGEIKGEENVEVQMSDYVVVKGTRHYRGEWINFIEIDRTIDGQWENNMGVTHWFPLPAEEVV